MSIDPALKRQLQTAAEKTALWRERRDDLIRRASAEGGTLREIADVVGLWHTAVRKVIGRG